jgi:hypothetical protein
MDKNNQNGDAGHLVFSDEDEIDDLTVSPTISRIQSTPSRLSSQPQARASPTQPNTAVRKEVPNEQPPQGKKNDDLFGNFAKSLSRSFNTAIDGIEKAFAPPSDSEDESEDEFDDLVLGRTEQFRELFKHTSNEVILFESNCRTIVVGSVIIGHCYLSTNYFNFHYVNNFQQDCTVIIPLHTIDKVAPGSARTASDSKQLVVTFYLEPGQSPNVLQLWTNDGRMHQFFAFKRDFPKVMGIVSHAIQSAKRRGPPPAAQPQYVPYLHPKAPSPDTEKQ